MEQWPSSLSFILLLSILMMECSLQVTPELLLQVGSQMRGDRSGRLGLGTILGTINVPMDELGKLAEERKVCAWSGLLTL